MVITERGCARQVYQYQALERGKWKTITTIMEETYTSGCVKDSDWAEHMATDTEYCYCDHNRCNDDSLLAQADQDEEEEDPLRSDYQDNLLESNGLQVGDDISVRKVYISLSPQLASHGIEEKNFYNLTSQNKSSQTSCHSKTFLPFLLIILTLIAL